MTGFSARPVPVGLGNNVTSFTTGRGKGAIFKSADSVRRGTASVPMGVGLFSGGSR